MKSNAKVIRYNGLQLLRVVAAFSVVLSHFSGSVVAVLGPSHHVWWSGGKAGVDIFFVVSGFVMFYTSTSLLKRPDGWKIFAQRRLIRVVPLYWLASTFLLATMFLLPALFRRPAYDLSYIARSFLFLPATTVDGQVVPLLSVGWTLNFEMFFYAVFCVVLWIRKSTLLWVSLVMCVCAAMSLMPLPHDRALTFYFSPIVLDFVAGMFIAKAMSRELRLAPWLAVITVLGSACVLGITVSNEAWHELLLSGLPAMLLVYATASLEASFERLPSLFLVLADASYAMYLFHIFVLDVARTRLHSVAWMPTPLIYCIVTVIVVVVSIGLRRFVEAPALRALNHRFSTRATDVLRQGDIVASRPS